MLGQLRIFLAKRLGLVPENEDHFLWVVDFPLLAYDSEEKRYVANHHPFTAPFTEDLDLLEKDPLAVRSQAYDLVYNGVEIAGGSIRVHKKEVQEKIFNMLGMNAAEAEERFGFFLNAFEYGIPPHGGIAGQHRLSC